MWKIVAPGEALLRKYDRDDRLYFWNPTHPEGWYNYDYTPLEGRFWYRVGDILSFFEILMH